LIAIAAVVLGAAGWVLMRQRAARAETVSQQADRLAAAAALDLVAVCVAAGLTPGAAASRVAGMQKAPAWLAAVDEALAAGVPLHDALGRPGVAEREWLRRALDPVAAASRSGGPVPDALDRAVSRLRDDVRRDREERARRLPVALLLPLTCCVLPAVVLVVVAPMLVRMLIGVS